MPADPLYGLERASARHRPVPMRLRSARAAALAGDLMAVRTALKWLRHSRRWARSPPDDAAHVPEIRNHLQNVVVWCVAEAFRCQEPLCDYLKQGLILPPCRHSIGSAITGGVEAVAFAAARPGPAIPVRMAALSFKNDSVRMLRTASHPSPARELRRR